MHARARRVLRIETRMSRTGAPAISGFLRFATTQELWQIVPAMWTEMPEQLQQEYRLISTTAGLRCLYAGTEDSIRFMLELLLQRWHRTEPAHVAAVLDECTAFLRCHRARTHNE